MPKIERVLAALAKQGLLVTHDASSSTYAVRAATAPPDSPTATVLLPESFPIEGKALTQLANLAATQHPLGGRVHRCTASPDFHPGDGAVAIGSSAEMQGIVVPGAVGTDIACGMRLHVVDLTIDQFLAVKAEVVRELTGHYFLGTRDLPLSGRQFHALFTEGLFGLLQAFRTSPRRGLFANLDLDSVEANLDRTFDLGSLSGATDWMPPALTTLAPDDFIRDDGLSTVGGGNHFVEIQTVHEITDRSAAYRLGIRQGQVALMIHSGSRFVGKHVGSIFATKAREAWPHGLPFPDSGLFPLSEAHTPDLLASYIAAENAAGNYAFANRLLLAELFKLAIQRHYDVGMPLVFDVPHNLTRRENDAWVVRKGACPAHDGQPTIIPGSMGATSYLCLGKGNDQFLSTASHGAGRASSRQSMNHVSDLGLTGVECITLREERRVEEAPAAYKDIGPVIDVQVRAGIIDVVAKLRPVLTFKA